MKAIRIHKYGHSDQLHLEDTETPKLQNNQVLVKVHIASVNPIDWKIREGFFKDFMPSQFPLTLGQDFAGVVSEVGSEVRNFRKGDRVYGFAHGAYAEYVAVTEDVIARIPTKVDDKIAASIPTAGLTAFQLVMKTIKPSQGQTLLIVGAAGSVGAFATQLALSKGAKVVATAAKADEPYLWELGVSQVFDYKTEKYENKLKDIDAVIDLVGGDTQDRCSKIIKQSGVYATTVGPLDQNLASAAGYQAVQFMVKQNSEDLAAMAELVERGILKVKIQEVLPLEKAPQAQDSLESSHTQGKILLEVSAFN